jgi:hypothetical protein
MDFRESDLAEARFPRTPLLGIPLYRTGAYLPGARKNEEGTSPLRTFSNFFLDLEHYREHFREHPPSRVLLETNERTGLTKEVRDEEQPLCVGIGSKQ